MKSSVICWCGEYDDEEVGEEEKRENKLKLSSIKCDDPTAPKSHLRELNFQVNLDWRCINCHLICVRVFTGKGSVLTTRGCNV